jgi:hypothetical protein
MSIFNQSSLIVSSNLLIGLLASQISWGQLQGQFYNAVTTTSCSEQAQVVLCALDSQSTQYYKASHGQCVVGCNMLDGCNWYNFITDIGLCQLFPFQPIYFGFKTGCSLYQSQVRFIVACFVSSFSSILKLNGERQCPSKPVVTDHRCTYHAMSWRKKKER